MFRYQALFVANAFDGALLHNASDDMLQPYVESLGIESLLHRARVILLLKEVRARGSLEPSSSVRNSPPAVCVIM